MRVRAPVAIRGLKDPELDRLFRNHDERLRELERLLTTQGFVELIQNFQSSFTILNQGAAYVYGASSLTTSGARRWLVFPGQAAGTSVAASGYFSVPNGITRARGLALAVFAGGTAGQTITYTVTEGDPTSEVDTALKIVTASNFFGTVNITGSVPVTPGRALRVAADKSAALAVAPTGVAIYVQLAAA